MKTRRYAPEDAARISRLNERLAAGHVPWPVFGEGPVDQPAGQPISSRLFVAANEDEVHGAVWLREHQFWIGGEPVQAGWAKYPVGESLVDPAYNGVPGALVFRLLREQPLLMALGMGGQHGAFAKLLRGMGWSSTNVPFYVLPVRPARVLRRLGHLRKTAGRRLVLDALAYSGAGWLGWTVVSTLRRAVRPPAPAGYEAEVVASFEEWANAVWERARPHYGLIARRDADMLNMVYPGKMPVVRLRIRRGGRDIGWACVLRRDLTAAKETPFGPLRVGLIADGLAEPEHAHGVVAAAVQYLRGTDLDLLFSNQSHPVWGAALEALGFLTAPSQFALSWSPQMDAALAAGGARGGLYVNRGDCDGPVFA